MAHVFIPTLLRAATGGASEVTVTGCSTVREVVDALEQLFPGVGAKLTGPNMAIAVDGEVSPIGLMEHVGPDSEVHFVTAIKGGAARPR